MRFEVYNMHADQYYLMKLEDVLRNHENDSDAKYMVSKYLEVAQWRMPSRGYHNLWCGLYSAVLDNDEEGMRTYVHKMMEVSK